MRKLMLTASAACLVPALAGAQITSEMCGDLIDATAARLPETPTPQSAERLGLTPPQLEAVLAALDAARLSRDDDPGSCLSMVGAAQVMLARGAQAGGEMPMQVADLAAWDYGDLYETTWRAEALIGAEVYNMADEEVGEVENLLMTPGGTITAVVVEVGGVADIGDQEMRVGWSGVRFRDGADAGITVKMMAEELSEFSLFGEDETAGPQVEPSEIRATRLIGQRVRLRTGEAFGYIDDLLISDGQVQATLMMPDIGYAGSRYPTATPYYSYNYGYIPGVAYYTVPYDREQLEELGAFDTGKLAEPGGPQG
jgi:sporulation protein YlmC with PRC-barrel domain